MRHLFIINPVAKRIKGETKGIYKMIRSFFNEHPDLRYDIFESRWCRDSLTFIRRYITDSDEAVRVHSIGGNGTLFEVVNSIVGLPNAEVAAHPYGSANAFLRYFGVKNQKHFLNLENMVFGRTVSLDIIRCGNNYGMGFALAGIEAYANMKGDEWIANGMPEDIAYILAAIVRLISGKAGQKYYIEIDEHKIEGDFISILTANTPCYGKSMYPAVDAHPDDGFMDVYIFKNASRFKLLSSVSNFTKGNYRKIPNLVSHYRAKRVKLSSDSVMCMSVDAQSLYGTAVEYELIPNAINFVCPKEVNLAKLPLIYKKPKEGLRT